MTTRSDDSQEKSISRLSIAGIAPFTQTVELNFDKRINVFIGPNATGKSTVLRALRSPRDHEDGFPDNPPFARLRGTRGWPKLNERDGTPHWDDLPWIYIPATRKGVPNNVEVLAAYQNIIHDDRNSAPDDGIRHEILDGEQIYLEILSLYRESATSRNSAVDIIEAVYDCVKDIGGEVFTGNTPAHYEGDPSGGANLHKDPNDEPKVPIVGVRTVDNTSRPLFIGMLSSGTQGQYLWILHMALTMARWYGYRPDWQTQPGILLIDEIENQLHPMWQRRVLRALTNHFPNLQIFAATHSPMIVAGLSAGQVHLFRRDSDAGHIVKAETLSDRDIKGWTANEILRTLMGLDEPTDEAAENAKRELDCLHKEGTRSNTFEEQQRQEEIERLRREIGGPVMAQREQFTAEFAAALSKYRNEQPTA